MFNTLYKKCLNLAAHKSSKYYLALVSFLESSFFPIPPDVMMVPMIISKKNDFQIETRFGSYRLRAYQQTTNDAIHIALTKGDWNTGETIPTRINSTLVNNDVLGTLTNDADKKLDEMFRVINKKGKGAIVFINQNSSPEKTLKRLIVLKDIQQDGTVVKAPSINMDEKDFGIGAQILHDLNIQKLNLISNSKQKKRVGMIGYGLEIIDYINY